MLPLRPRIARATVAACCAALVQCSSLRCAASAGCQGAATSPQSYTSGSAVRPASSVWIPSRAPTSSPAGSAPTATRTTSLGCWVPSARTTARSELPAQALGIGERTEEVDSGAGQAGQAAGPGACRDHERVQVQVAPRRSDELPCELDAADTRARDEADFAVSPGARRLERQVAVRAGEKGLRERGPFVRRMWLLADQRDRTVEALGAERLGAALPASPAPTMTTRRDIRRPGSRSRR
jgi:hypothetical protein